MDQIENSKLAFKHWSTIVILAIIAIFIGWFLLNLGPIIDGFNGWLYATKVERETKRLEDLYKNDKYGAETPEETFDLFIEALKNKDIELASKYFVIKKQDNWLRTLQEYKNNSLLADFIVELRNINRSNVSFEKYPSGIWKIEVL